jgi:L-threonylcarbamoyladenylate synthase
VSLTAADARAFERCITGGGVAVFPADTVYGVACDPDSSTAVTRLYGLKGRPPAKPAAVMFFALQPAFAALPELGARTRAALEALLPGAVTLLLPNPRGLFPLACGPDPQTLGLRVPALPQPIAALGDVSVAVLQSSANLAGAAEARTLDAVATSIRDGADLVLDGGEVGGVASTVVDLRRYEEDAGWSVLREGAVRRAALVDLLG